MRITHKNNPFTMLVILCCFVSLPVMAGQCDAWQEQYDGEPDAFEKNIYSLKTGNSVKEHIKNVLCSNGNIFAFLTGEDGYQYGRCFIPANEADSFWNADQQKTQSLISKYRADCVNWAKKRYQPLMARLDKQKHKPQMNKPLPKPEQKQTEVAATKLPKIVEHQSMQQAIKAARDTYSEGIFQWSRENRTTQVNTKLAAYLLATEMLAANKETETSYEHAQQHFNEMMGKPRVISVTPSGKQNEYRVRIQSRLNDYTIDALAWSETPLIDDITPWVLFSRQAHNLVPVIAVLQTPRQVISTTQLENNALQLSALPDHNVTRLVENAGAVKIQFLCVPHDGGRSMPLGHCLKPDGEISILTADSNERFIYENLSRKQRDYQSNINAPFVLLARTGSANRRGEIQLRVTDITQPDQPTLYDQRAVARRDSLLLYSE